MSRKKTFVILTTQRSGSGWLVDLLDDHPSIAAYEEMFKVTETTVASHGASAVPRFEVMVRPGTFSTSPGLVQRRHQYVRGLGRAHPLARAVGFKLMYDQTRDHPGLMGVLTLMHARFIHLVRRDTLGAIVSYDIAHERDRWHYLAGDTIPTPRVHLDTTTLVDRLRERENEIAGFRRRLRRMAVPVLEIAYEDLVVHHDGILGEILGVLGVVPARRPLRSSVVRATPGRVWDLIENRDDVVAALAGTRFASFAR